MIQYTYKSRPVEILQVVLEDTERTGDDPDWSEYARVQFEDGTEDTISAHLITPDPVRILMGAAQTHDIFCCAAYTTIKDGQPQKCRVCGGIVR